MHSYSLEHVASSVLIRDLTTLVAQDRATTASLLAHISEVKERKLYRGAGQPSMQDYCVNVLRFSEDSAKKRLQAAGVARRFPLIFEALADGRLHLSGVCLLAPHLEPENAEELISAAMNKTRADIEKLLAHRFPQADLPEVLQVVVAPGSPSGTFTDAKSAHTDGGRPISHVLKRALEHYVRHLKQRKFAETERPRRAERRPWRTSDCVVGRTISWRQSRHSAPALCKKSARWLGAHRRRRGTPRWLARH